MDDRYFMKMALELAARGRGYAAPNPMVGAVLVKNGRVVGRGYHAAAGTPHAEVNAINDAGEAALDATLYVSLEPCNHHGRTPPCTEKIIRAGISRVMVAMRDPNPHVTGGGLQRLKAEGIRVTTGIYEKEALRLNESFVKYILTERPFVIVKSAATLDGRIATRTGDSKWVTGEASRRFVHQMRHAVDGIVVGIATVREDNPSLTVRLEDTRGVDPVRIVLDTRLSIPDNAGVLGLDSPADTIIVMGKAFAAQKRSKIARLKGLGAKIVEMPLKNGLIDLSALMEHLGQAGIASLLVEGGGQVTASVLREKIADKIVFFYAPKIMGGDDAVPMCAGPGPSLMRNCIAVKDIHIRRFEDDLMIEGYPVWPESLEGSKHH